MKILKPLFMAFAVCMFISAPAMAEEAHKGTAEEAKALSIRAAEYIQEVGKDKAFEVFNNGEESFRKGDLYVFVMDFEANMLSHGTKPAIIGKKLWDFKDTDGKAFFQDFVKVAKEEGSGWVDYKWPNPVTNQVEPKSSYIKRVGDKEMFTGVGVYR
jgi:signal transduction histidine kinase